MKKQCKNGGKETKSSLEVIKYQQWKLKYVYIVNAIIEYWLLTSHTTGVSILV